MKKLVLAGIPFAFFLIAVFLLVQQTHFIEQVERFVLSKPLWQSYSAYVALLTLAVVCMPFTVLPLIPVVSSIFGPFVTGVLSVIGWTLGATAAFLISRYLGKPFLERFISLNALDDIVRMAHGRSRFFLIIVMRLALPVDIVSYALGLAKSLGFTEYFLATVIGVVWFSFSFAYLGDALLSGNILLVIQLSIATLVISILGWYLLRRSKKR